MTARAEFKMQYRHLRKQLRKGANRANWLHHFKLRAGAQQAAALAVEYKTVG